jgi:mono/diheme cytochrome c family protein
MTLCLWLDMNETCFNIWHHNKKRGFRGGCLMRASVLAAVVAVGVSTGASAQSAPDASFTEAQREGLRLFSQSCGVCHTTVQQRARQYAPALSRDTLGGDEELMRQYISNGTPRMPGFRYNFEPEEINAIVSYIKTVPPQPAPAGAR